MTTKALLLWQWSLYARVGVFDTATGDLRLTTRESEHEPFQGVFDFLNGHAVGIYGSGDSLIVFVDTARSALDSQARLHVRPASWPVYEGESELVVATADTLTVLLNYLPMPDANLPWWEDAFDASKQDFGRYLETITSDPDRRNRLIQMWSVSTKHE